MKLAKLARSLTARLVAMGLVMSTIGTALSYFQLSHFLRKDLAESVAVQQTALAGYVARDVDNYLSERMSFLERLAASLPPEALSHPQQLRAWLQERSALSPAFRHGLKVSDLAGERLDGTDRIATDSLEFDGARAGQSTFGRALKIPGSQHSALPMATPIRDRAGQVTALLLGTADLSADGLLDHLQYGRVGQTGGILVVSPRDQLFVASTDAARPLQATPPVGVNLLHDRAMTGFRGSGTTRNADGIEEISAIASVPSSGWFVVARLPVAEALSPIARMQDFILLQRMPAVIAVLTLLGLAVAWLLRPLMRAANQAEKMARGELELTPFPVVRNDEIGHLTMAFNQLLAKLTDNQAELKHLAHHDTLTGLPNRKLLDERLRQTLARTKRNAGVAAVLYLDLDGFKRLNDTFGHEAGDKALRETARRLLHLVQHSDTMARIGGDEFILVVADLEEPAERAVLALAQQCIDAVALPLQHANTAMGVSIGIALTDGGTTPEDLLAAADKAMYMAKQNGRGGYALAPRSIHSGMA